MAYPFRQYAVVFIVLTGITSLVIYMYHSLAFNGLHQMTNIANITKGESDDISILWYDIPSYFIHSIQDQNMSACEFNNCHLISNISKFKDSSVVIFSHKSIPKLIQKLPGQIWVFYSLESPYHTYKARKYVEGKFNWTMTYRRDSDFHYPYARLEIRATKLSRNYTDVFLQKSKDAVWIASHCVTPSRREKYVKELQKYITVDIYGSCGPNKCGSRENIINSRCNYEINTKYRFYLAFENSICKDYTTEKLFNLFLPRFEMVPVVRGSPSVKEYIPNGTYIDAMEYKNPKELAKALKNIGSDEQKYTQYLREKDKYVHSTHKRLFHPIMCEMCRRANEKKFIKTIANITEWMWHGACA